ncbi:MAG: hypothetical protein OHK0029_28440 [Armatimonadaceae bacterium]
MGNDRTATRGDVPEFGMGNNMLYFKRKIEKRFWSMTVFTAPPGTKGNSGILRVHVLTCGTLF